MYIAPETYVAPLERGGPLALTCSLGRRYKRFMDRMPRPPRSARGWARTLGRSVPALALALPLVVAPLGCWEPNPFFVELEGGGSSSGQASSSSGLLPTTGTDTGVATSAMTSDGTSTSGEPTSTTAADGSSGSDGGSDSSTGGTPPAYPECMVGADPVCPEPYTECYQYAEPTHSFCTLDCTDDVDCPVATEGTAIAICAPMISQCVLDCAGGTTCPTGMECIQVGPGLMFDRCAWPN